jgi:hypothetical protein
LQWQPTYSGTPTTAWTFEDVQTTFAENLKGLFHTRCPSSLLVLQ